MPTWMCVHEIFFFLLFGGLQIILLFHSSKCVPHELLLGDVISACLWQKLEDQEERNIWFHTPLYEKETVTEDLELRPLLIRCSICFCLQWESTQSGRTDCLNEVFEQWKLENKRQKRTRLLAFSEGKVSCFCKSHLQNGVAILSALMVYYFSKCIAFWLLRCIGRLSL